MKPKLATPTLRQNDVLDRSARGTKMAVLPKLHPRILDIRNATMITREHVLEPGLIMRTDVTLRRSDPGFDEKEFEDFLDAVGKYHDKYGIENILVEGIDALVP